MKSLKGRLLVAAPELTDPNFIQTVILMLEHSDEGALGVIINRPTDAMMTDVAEQILEVPLEWDKPLHLGGPVSGPLIVLHTVEALGDEEVVDGVQRTIDSDKIRDLLTDRTEPCRVVINYAGWGPGQLEREFEEASWVAIPATRALILEESAAMLWDFLIRRYHADSMKTLLKIRETPDDPSVN